MTTEITLNIGFENITNDKKMIFCFTGDANSKVAVEKGIANFAVFSDQVNDSWQFINWSFDSKTGTIFNTFRTN